MPARGIASAPVSRLKSLQQKHSALSSQIFEAQNSPSTTDFYLRQLKKMRLLVKDEMELLRSSNGSTRH